MKTKLMRRTGIAAASAAAMFSMAACGAPDGASAPKNASVKDFCKVMTDLAGAAADPEKAAEDMVAVGTPKGIPAGAREGFEIIIENATEEKISEARQKKVNTLMTYFASTCTGS